MGIKGTRGRTSIAEALFSRTQQRVLGVLFGDAERAFSASELFQRTRGGRGTVQRELQRLVGSGLVTVTAVRNQKQYRANPASPVFEELRSIFLKTSGLADPIRDALKPLAPKIELAFIYGSVARNEAHAGSDVDLMIAARDLTLEKLFTRLAPAEELLARKINPTLYTPEEFRKRVRSSPFVQKVISGPTIPLIGTIDVSKGAGESR
jgi:predicted nucleotidyltransferase